MFNSTFNVSAPSIFRRAVHSLRKLVPQSPRGYLAWSLVPIAIATSLVAVGSGTPPAIPPVTLATEPLYAAMVVDKPAIALALSVEFPTVGAQYVEQPNTTDDSSYSFEKEYLGYYDAEACYIYNNSPTETPPSGFSSPDLKRFDRSNSAINRKCTGETFSGNFLNWASSSAVDMLRLALSGGDRYIDTPSLTILQRAVLPDSSVSTNFWNGTNFPSKNLTRAGKNSANDFWGAIPQSMRATAGTSNIAIANDKNKIYFRVGTKSGNTNASATNYTLGSTGAIKSNTDGFFYARVKVCESDTSGALLDNRDYELCKQYPAGNYKPTGAIQKYSNQLRLAAFGYMPQTKNNSAGGATFGGVLRAPMKYVGAKTYNINGQDNTSSTGNPNAEWNSNTGEFIKNPDSDTEFGNSGVINYLNKFGRTGTTQGLYKYYDPLGELYYETLRYLQGLPPTSAAISGVTTAMKDGFPVYTTWNDPYGGGRTPSSDYSCLKSNIVVIGDVNIDSSGSSRYPSTSATNNVPDITGWLNTVNNFEKGASSNYVDGQGVTRSTGNPNTPNNSMPSDKMIGLSYWAHTHDIRGTNWTGEGGPTGKQRPGLRVKTFTFDVNEFAEQKPDNVRRNQNELFMTAKYGGFQSDPSNAEKKPYNTFGNPFKRQDGTNDNDVWRDPNRLGPNGASGGIGEASTYYLQSDARGVLSAFDEIFSRASTSSRSVAGGGLSTGSKVTSGSLSYSAKFDTSNWNGDVVAEPISQNATTKDLVIGSALWSAAQRLDNMTSPSANRKIFVGRAGATTTPTATAFTWAAIDATLQADLNKASPSAATDTLGSDRLTYLRGDKTKEGAPFRVRSSLLGDIVSSNVVYSGALSKAFTGTGYAAFRSAYGSRTAAVFAGANDGMLHAFNAATGDELFAFIPSWLGRNLSALADPAYINNHQNYVDAPAAVGEAQVANTGAATDWKTVLVSGTGGGGSGVFALDVSDPSNFGASNVMWEFTRADDEDMGQVIGEPKILKIKTSGTSATATYRWFAVVGSGVNNYVPDSANRFSATGKPALFLLALDKPAGTAWALGTNYFKVSVPTNATLAATHAAGLANFSALFGAQGEMTDIYMGDFHGALWRLQFSGKPTTDWNMDKLSFFNKGTASSPVPYPLFIARTSDATPKVQPLFAAPTPFVGPTVGGVESFYVAIGTGKYLESGDNISTTQQSFYIVYDNGSTAADSSPISSAISGRGRLSAGTLNTTTRTVTVSAFKWGRPASNTDTTQRAGWYFDLPDPGERIDQAALNVGSLYAAINSKIPGSTAAGAGSCTNTLGGGNQYFLNINNGSGIYTPSTMGLLGQPVMLSSDDETVVSKSDSTGKRIRTVTHRRFSAAQGGIDTSAAPVTTKETIGRLSWRQIFNYQDIKNK